MGKDKGNGLCTYCNVTKISQKDFTYGHIISED